MGRKAGQGNSTPDRKGTGTQGSHSDGHTSQAPGASEAIKDSAVISTAKHLQVRGRQNGQQEEFWLWTARSDPTGPMSNLCPVTTMHVEKLKSQPRNGSMVKRTCCSCRTRVQFPAPHNGSQLPTTMHVLNIHVLKRDTYTNLKKKFHKKLKDQSI